MDSERLLAELAGWAESQQASIEARARSRRRWLRQQAAEDATLAGILLDLAESSVRLTVRTLAGAHCGVVAAVSTRMCVLSCDEGFAVIALSAITMITPPGPALGDRVPTLAMDLGDVLSVVGADRPAVQLELVNGRTVDGMLQEVGRDVVTLSRPHALIPIASIGVCRF
jgi:hypothetical protein